MELNKAEEISYCLSSSPFLNTANKLTIKVKREKPLILDTDKTKQIPSTNIDIIFERT